MSEWRPIETAPKDGTPILVWLGYCMTTAYYQFNWWQLCETGAYADDGMVTPILWTTLPEPPSG